MRLRRASASEGEVASTATMVTQAHLNALAVRAHTQAFGLKHDTDGSARIARHLARGRAMHQDEQGDPRRLEENQLLL